MPSESYDPSYYELLGVPTDAGEAEIGKAFMRAMREAHPDQHGTGSDADQAAAEEHARLLTEAHGVLTGPERAGYDARLREHRGAPAPRPRSRPAQAPSAAPASAPTDLFDPSQEAVLRLTRERWQRGGTLVPHEGGRPIVVPPEVGHDEVLVFEGRGSAVDEAGGVDGPADLHVRVLHVDRRGRVLPRGHGAGTSALERFVREMSPAVAALVTFGLVAVLVGLVGYLALG